MICILALVVFSITGLFSTTHRQWAKEAFDCVFRRITLRPCNTGFDLKMKGMILGRLMNRSLFATKMVNKHFELISWFFVILTFLSLFFTVRGLYNFYMYGSCNGLNQTGFCVFDPTGKNNKLTQSSTSDTCPVVAPSSENVSLDNIDLSQFPTISRNAKETVVFVACYGCEYSRKAYPLMKKLKDENSINLVFVHFPVKNDSNYLMSVDYCTYKQNQDAFWILSDKLFAVPVEDLDKPEKINELIQASGYDLGSIQECIANPQTQEFVNKTTEKLSDTGIYGTPTVFIKDTVLVGPKPYSVYERILRRWW